MAQAINPSWKELEKYRGKWVAVHKGNVIAAGDYLKETLEEAKKIYGKPEVFQVPREEEVYV